MVAPSSGESRRRHDGKAESVVQLPAGEQAGVGGDLRPVELELETAVEGDPERWLLGFTRRVRHPEPT